MSDDMRSLIDHIISKSDGDPEKLLLDFISVVSLRAGMLLGSKQSSSIDASYHDALREAYVALGGKSENMY